MNQDYGKLVQQYEQKQKEIPYLQLPRMYRFGQRGKRFGDQMITIKHKWIVAKNGFFYGAMSGSVLGLVFGMIPFMKTGQPSIIIASVLVSGGMFSCIGGFGSMLHSG